MRLIECVPNFSEGKDENIINSIILPIKQNSSVHLLDVDMGFDTNRTVVTFVGKPNDVIKVAFECIKIASNLIDMSKHKGEHPRMGATDVCPLIPVKNVSMNECIKLSKDLARKVSSELNIPIFLYENSASNKKRKSLSYIRSGQYEAFSQKFTKKEWNPDYGKAVLNVKSGVTAIGAREFLIAYNVNLNTQNKKIATDIALDIRESGRAKRDKDGLIMRDSNGKMIKKKGKFNFCKAVGWYIDEYNQAQVSINLTNYKKTSMHKVFDEVRKQARKRGVRVTGSEIVGLVPLKAIINSGKFYLKKQKSPVGLPEKDIIDIAIKSLGLSEVDEFKPKDKIIDYTITSNNNVFKNQSISNFIDHISRNTPTPGGGSASALSAALGVSLSTMVANLSVGRKDLMYNYDKFIKISEDCQNLKDIFLELIDKDSEAYDNVINAIRLPKKSDQDKKLRKKAIVEATIYAAEMPLKILEKSVPALEQTLKIAENGNPNSITDVGVGASLIRTAAYGASLNVLINAKDLDVKKTNYFNEKVDYYLKQIEDLFLRIDKIVNKILND